MCFVFSCVGLYLFPFSLGDRVRLVNTLFFFFFFFFCFFFNINGVILLRWPSLCLCLSYLTLSVPNFRRLLSSVFNFNKPSLGKTFICKVERLTLNSVDPDETAH